MRRIIKRDMRANAEHCSICLHAVHDYKTVYPGQRIASDHWRCENSVLTWKSLLCLKMLEEETDHMMLMIQIPNQQFPANNKQLHDSLLILGWLILPSRQHPLIAGVSVACNTLKGLFKACSVQPHFDEGLKCKWKDRAGTWNIFKLATNHFILIESWALFQVQLFALMQTYFRRLKITGIQCDWQKPRKELPKSNWFFSFLVKVSEWYIHGRDGKHAGKHLCRRWIKPRVLGRAYETGDIRDFFPINHSKMTSHPNPGPIPTATPYMRQSTANQLKPLIATLISYT